MEPKTDTKRNRCYSEGDIAEASNIVVLKLRRDLSRVNDDDIDSDSERCRSDSESSDDDRIEQEKRKIEEEMEKMRLKMESLNAKEKKKKKKQKKREQTSQSCPQSLDSLSNQHSTQTEKVKFELGENDNVTQNSLEENVALREKRGLVVVCCHKKFASTSHTLSSRPSAAADLDMMGDVWKKYGCEVMEFSNEGNKFYMEYLFEKIEEKLDLMERLEFFVFILSTHGEEKDERIIGGDANFQHYFYTNDGQVHTQTLMNGIAEIDGLQEKVKAFFIQACRSRANPKSESKNLDLGFKMEVIEKIPNMEELQPQNSQEASARSCGITVADAKGYMPSDDEDIPEAEPTEEDIQVDIDNEPVALYPHCENSIVEFSSMSGKFAYSLKNSIDEGGWLIKSLNDVLRSYKSGDEIFILDALTEVNRKVSKREAENNKNYPDLENIEQLKAQSCFLHNITEEFYLKRE